MYIRSLAAQTQIFLYCIGFGFFLGIVFDFVRFVRSLFSSSRAAVFIQDIIAFMIISVLIFFFLLCVSGGELRFYSLLGLLAGYVIYHYTLGFAAAFLTEKVCRQFIRAKNHIKSKFKSKK